VPCHRADGGGVIGPNLTDDYWIHGARPTELLKVVREGVPDKGMPTWSQILKPDEIVSVVVYVLTLHDTHPAAPKEPQGTKVEIERD
jgi:cytochrome c oxidase cbb3-type subunit 3